VATCNETGRISDYFINRPGRFYYHFRFRNPDADTIAEYLNDNLNDKSSIDSNLGKILSISHFGSFNFDSLRTIVEELNNGYSFDEAIEDLNVQIESICEEVRLTATTEDGMVFVSNEYITFPDFDKDGFKFSCQNDNSIEIAFCLSLNHEDMKYDRKANILFFDVNKLNTKYHNNVGRHQCGEKVKLKSLVLEVKKQSDYCMTMLRNAIF